MDYIRFRSMVAPAIIQIFFWIGAIGSIVVGALIVTGSVGGLVGRFLENNGGFYIGLVILILGPIVARVSAEMMIVFFRLYETMISMDQRLQTMEATEHASIPGYSSMRSQEPVTEPGPVELEPEPVRTATADSFSGAPEPKPESRIVH
jgi:hypothetical protein